MNSLLDWKAYRFTYEFDFVSRNHGFVGLLLDAKYTDVIASLQSPIDFEKIHAQGADPDHWRHRSLLHRPEHLDHG